MYTGTDFISTKFARAHRQGLSKKRYRWIKRNHMFSAVGSITSTLSTPYNGKRQVGVVASYTLYIFAPPTSPRSLIFPSVLSFLYVHTPPTLSITSFWYTVITICQCFCFSHHLKNQKLVTCLLVLTLKNHLLATCLFVLQIQCQNI